MSIRRASEPVSVVVVGAALCALTLTTGWLVLRGASFVAAVPAMAVFTFVFVELLVRVPRRER